MAEAQFELRAGGLTNRSTLGHTVVRSRQVYIGFIVEAVLIPITS